MQARECLTRVMMWGLLLLAAGSGGCASWDRHVFESTQQRPASVSVVDAEDGETLWRLDVPPNHRLTLDLANSDEVGAVHVSGKPATHMNWKLHRIGQATDELDLTTSRRINGGRVELERRLVRIDVVYHKPGRHVRTVEPEELDLDVDRVEEVDVEEGEAEPDDADTDDDEDQVEAAMATANDADRAADADK